jgi:ATP/ADP translocase
MLKPSTGSTGSPNKLTPHRSSLRSPTSQISPHDRKRPSAGGREHRKTRFPDYYNKDAYQEQQEGEDEDDEMDEVFDDAPMNQGLLTHKRKALRGKGYFASPPAPNEWQRPYWLGFGLFLILFAFWLLDSLKDPTFARLVDGKIHIHQPTAKLFSVASTLVLVCLLEYVTNLRQRQRQEAMKEVKPSEEILNPGGVWRRMAFSIRSRGPTAADGPKEFALDDNVSVVIFFQIGIPYVVAFLVIAYLVRRFEHQEGSLEEGVPTDYAVQSTESTFDAWYVLGYVMCATIESFGSLAVATFWSYTNSTLSLHDAERYYGPVIAIAQLGAIGGSTLVASDRWDPPVLFVVVAMSIVLQLLLMHLYDRRFEPTSILVEAAASSTADDTQSVLTWQDDNATLTKPFWSGLYLIFKHPYVFLILGVSCLYEISMTVLDYQMKLLGYARFDTGGDGRSGSSGDDTGMSFSVFMGRYGQVVNFTSLIFSSIFFPWAIRRFGLRKTLLFFPTMLLLVTFLAYGALPGNLTVLFLSLSLLKAMTYSVHDPSKELLYIPTSNAVKFRAKFWIDVVGERISKAIGSSFNTFSKSVEQSLKIGVIPSFLSAFGLWLVCYYVGVQFDKLIATGKIVGLENSIDPSTYSCVPRTDDDTGLGDDYSNKFGRSDDSRTSANDLSEVEILFEEDNVSTLDLMADPIRDSARNTAHESLSGTQIELPSLFRR